MRRGFVFCDRLRRRFLLHGEDAHPIVEVRESQADVVGMEGQSAGRTGEFEQKELVRFVAFPKEKMSADGPPLEAIQ